MKIGERSECKGSEFQMSLKISRDRKRAYRLEEMEQILEVMFSIKGASHFILNSTGSHWGVFSREMGCLLVKTDRIAEPPWEKRTREHHFSASCNERGNAEKRRLSKLDIHVTQRPRHLQRKSLTRAALCQESDFG